jgi:signal transduction histidine kinase
MSQATQQRDLKETGIAMAVHDLKGYLAVISGQAKLLRASKLGPVTAQQSEALADIVAGCRLIEQQIVKLLNPAANTANEWKPLLKKADLRKCLLDIYTLLRPEFTENQLIFEIELSEHPVRMPFDARLIRRVLLNLLENARRFTPPGGRVSVALAPEFWERRDPKFRAAFVGSQAKTNAPNCAKIVVADNGCGIPPTHHELIFEEYFSTPAPGSQLSSGLGLAITRNIVLAHGGKIWVESAVGQGSRFCFFLPFVPPSTADGTSVEFLEAEDE